jgi:hypothetical protein
VRVIWLMRGVRAQRLNSAWNLSVLIWRALPEIVRAALFLLGTLGVIFLLISPWLEY